MALDETIKIPVIIIKNVNLTGNDEDLGAYEYEGGVVNGKRHGKGKIKWQESGSYEGYFVNDLRTGIGTRVWSDGTYYEGEFLEDFVTGKGKKIFPDGFIMEGEFLKSNLHGKGKFFDPGTGDTYEGDFNEGDIHGTGIYKWKNGDVFEGEWRNNKRHGKGKYTTAKGKIEEGIYKDGKYLGSFDEESLTTAAQQGDAQAQCDLGIAYYEGIFMELDYAKSVDLFIKSAKQGLPKAMEMLGKCYKYGHGVEKDDVKSWEWNDKFIKSVFIVSNNVS